MRASDLSLFTAPEQTLLVQTEKARLAELSEDELDELLQLVRRARNKYSKLHRRQSAASVQAAGKRYAATTSNSRTLRKAEVFEDALARVSQALSRAARAAAHELKRERLAMAAGEAPPARRGSRASARSEAGGSRPAASTTRPVSKRRAASTTASTARRQARRDAR